METEKLVTEFMYCVKCRMKVMVDNPIVVVWPNQKKALKGNCPKCNTLTFKVTKTEKT